MKIHIVTKNKALTLLGFDNQEEFYKFQKDCDLSDEKLRMIDGNKFQEIYEEYMKDKDKAINMSKVVNMEIDFNRAMNRVIRVLLALMVVMFVFALLMSCTTTKYIEVEKVRTDTTYITKWQKDSVWLHDSIHIKERGDTVMIERWHTQWRDRLRVDTIYRETHDTIPQPYPVETIKMVEKELSWWQRLRLWIGNIGLLGILGVIGYYGVKLRRVYKFF